MKKLLCLFLTLAMLLTCAAAFSEAQPEGSLFTPGTYSGEAQGIFVPVKVMVKVSENEIQTVLIDATGETPELGGVAAEGHYRCGDPGAGKCRRGYRRAGREP